ncbi:poly(ADP-ribose) glycohydrolase [Diachasma alloeum]|uniref:poly(ADP-ribose) glycohydrolase n=1 Tax=Diachasma alloeum TaxID=454923 RepID=UPI00073848ED|nr:poly(ADP-ribose) glycohydrolase [Diachasma alloeum]
MAKNTIPLEEGPMSPDVFSDPETQECSSIPLLDESYTSSTSDSREPEPSVHEPEWRGISIDEIQKGLGAFGFQQHPPISPSPTHTVLFQLPLENRGPPRPYQIHGADKWSVGYVRMPNSPHSLYPIEHGVDKPREFRMRWEIIQESLLQSFMSSTQLEAAILSYNNNYADRWDFCALHYFFSDVIDEEETEIFFKTLLPKMIQLALQLPTIVTGPIPLLKKHTNYSISMSQLQVASLLANAFFCTFPRRNSNNPQSEYALYPHINLNNLFACYNEARPNRSAAVAEKLKCLFHYFRRVTTTAPEGTITIQRHYIPKKDCPRWDKLHNLLPALHITSKGTIETEGAGLLQVDFANRYVGGGVLNWGCVQEEIRFVICPELIVTMLITEALDDTEALIVTGIERYSRYEGYSSSFKWAGNFVDETPRDTSGRRRTSIVAIDALYFTQADSQFNMKNIIRELNKAYVGFSTSEMDKNHLPAIATGNWGCGAFRGNPKLKVVIQLMAAAAAGRSMVYFTFGDANLRDSVGEMYWHLRDRNIDISRLFSLLRQYEAESTTDHSDFYPFLFNRSKIKPLTNYFSLVKSSNDENTNDKIINSTKSFVQAKVRDRLSSVHKTKLSDEEEEEERIRNMLEEYTDDTADKDAPEESCFKRRHTYSLQLMKEKTEFQSMVEGKDELYTEILKEMPDACTDEGGRIKRRTSPLDLLVSSHEIKNTTSNNHESNINRSKCPGKYSTLGKGQRKISDFFSLKTSLL